MTLVGSLLSLIGSKITSLPFTPAFHPSFLSVSLTSSFPSSTVICLHLLEVNTGAANSIKCALLLHNFERSVVKVSRSSALY